MRLRLAATTLAASFALVGVSAPAAEAHYVYDSGYPYASSTACTKIRSEISDGYYASGYFKADTNSDYRVFDVDCAGSWKRSAGQIRAAWNAFKLVNGAWSYCKSSGYKYNSEASTKFVVGTTWGSPQCGPGYYTATAQGHVYNGGVWNGGSWSSGSRHYLYNPL